MEQQKNCPACGNPLEFNPEHGTLHCSNCGESAGGISTGDTVIAHEDLLLQLRQQEAEADLIEQLVFSCSGCGAEITLDPNIIADHCPYCGSPVVAAKHSVRKIRPAALLPFRITRENAMQCYQKWLKSRWFLPGRVKIEARMMPPSGMYLPHWSYNAGAVTHYTGSRGKHYYVNVSYTSTVNGKTVRKTRRERRTRWYPAAGVVQDRFQDLLVPATRSLPADMLHELTPWDLPQLQPYAADFIRGFREESYSVTLREGFDVADDMMRQAITCTVKRDIGGDVQRIHSMQVSYHDLTFRHILLPVWTGSFQFREKSYTVLINARTGEVQGRRPYSIWKITALVLAIAAVCLAIGFWISQN